MPVLIRSDLVLLRRTLDTLAASPYFSAKTCEFVSALRSALDVAHRRLADGTVTLEVARFIVHEAWSSVQFLSGSTTNRIPYEIAYCLQRAMLDWTADKLVLCTALLDDRQYLFLGAAPDFGRICETSLGTRLPSQLVQVAFPALYQRFPIYCVPLYHELGHFIDRHQSIVEASELLSPYSTDSRTARIAAEVGCSVAEMVSRHHDVLRNHRREFFADLFAASYTGKSGGAFLRAFAGDAGITGSHPSVKERIAVIDAYCDGRPDSTVQILEGAASSLYGRAMLMQHFSTLSVDDDFSDLRPVDLARIDQVHGIFPAAWTYLERVSSSPFGPWTKIDREETESLINGLVEKSIRNFMIHDGWNHATTI